MVAIVFAVRDIGTTLIDLVMGESEILTEVDRRDASLLHPGGVGLDQSIRDVRLPHWGTVHEWGRRSVACSGRSAGTLTHPTAKACRPHGGNLGDWPVGKA